MSEKMGRKPKLTMEEMREINKFTGMGLGLRQIARQLGRSPAVVRSHQMQGAAYGRKRYKKRQGKISNKTKRILQRKASNQNVSAAALKSQYNILASRVTVWRAITENPNIRHCKLKGKPPLTMNHKIARLEWAKKYMHWTKEWTKVLFSDEKKFNLDGPDGFQYYYHDLRKEKQYFSKRQSGGGSVMIWAMIGWKGKSELVFLEGKQDSTKYVALLTHHLKRQAFRLGGKKWIFQQDLASIHNSTITKAWLKDNKVTVLDWPSKSPDMNIIENVWGILVRRVYAGGKQFDNIMDLKRAIIEAWDSITVSEIQKLYDSIKTRVFELIKANGGSTKY